VIRTKKSTIINTAKFLLLGFLLLYLLFPLWWTLVTSFKKSTEVLQWPPTLLPREFSLSAYIFTLINSPVPIFILNSLFYSGCTSLVVVCLASITTYGLSKYPYRGSKQIFMAFFLTRVVPPQILWLPLIIMYTRVGLQDTRAGVLLFLMALNYPLCIWMLKGLFDDVSDSLIDSALIDGCTRMRTLFSVVIPVTMPGIAAVAIIVFLWSWAEFMFTYLIIDTETLKPITVGIYYFVGDQAVQWNNMAASEVLSLLPALVFITVAQKRIVRGLTSGAVKG
jgi:multiple sugar transport system permease protein